MLVQSVDALVDTLRQHPVLSADQLDRLADEVALFDDPNKLATHLVKAGWLTIYQARKIVQGRAPELVLGNYVILDKLGEGGMGRVYKARQLRLNRLVALKVVRPGLLENATVQKRFQREATAAAQLAHPNIVRLFDADQVDGTHFLAMEFVQGSDLAKLVKENGPLPIVQACDYVRQAALGLQHAHDKGLVHRDIKPSNLLVTANGATVKVLDMGLARMQLAGENAGDSLTALTQAGTVVGSPDYMSPEQAKNSSTVDARADLYSLGCTFYFLLTGRPPFPNGTTLEKLLQHQTDPVPPVQLTRPDVPAGLAAVLDRLLAKEPGQRFPSAEALATALEPWCQTRPSAPNVPRVVPVPPTEVEAPPPPTTPAPGLEPTATESPFNFDLEPAKPARPAEKKPARGARAAKWPAWKIAAVAGGGLALLLIAILVGRGLAGKPHPTTEPESPTPTTPPKPAPRAPLEPVEKYLPADAAVVAVLDVKQLNASPVFRKHFRDRFRRQLADFEGLAGFDPLVAVERVIVAAPANDSSDVLVVAQGHDFPSQELLNCLDSNPAVGHEEVRSSDGKDHRLYLLGRGTGAGKPLYAAVVKENPATAVFGRDKQRVLRALARTDGRRRASLNDAGINSALANRKDGAQIWVGVGSTAKLNDRELEASGVSWLAAAVRVGDGLEVELTLDGPRENRLRQFMVARQFELKFASAQDERLAPLFDLLAHAEAKPEKRGLGARMHYHGRTPAEQLGKWLDAILAEKPRTKAGD